MFKLAANMGHWKTQKEKYWKYKKKKDCLVQLSFLLLFICSDKQTKGI